MRRNATLDALRGYALVCIMLNHIPAGWARQFTLTNFAIYDAAELFVLLSGFLVGMVWLSVETKQGRRAAQWRFGRRAAGCPARRRAGRGAGARRRRGRYPGQSARGSTRNRHRELLPINQRLGGPHS